MHRTPNRSSSVKYHLIHLALSITALTLPYFIMKYFEVNNSSKSHFDSNVIAIPVSFILILPIFILSQSIFYTQVLKHKEFILLYVINVICVIIFYLVILALLYFTVAITGLLR